MPKQKTIEQLREEEQQEELKLIQQERAAKEEARRIKATRLALQQRKYIEIGKLAAEHGLDHYDTQTLHAGLSMLAEMLKNEQETSGASYPSNSTGIHHDSEDTLQP